MDELVAKFLPRFSALANQRLGRALELTQQRQHARADAIAHDLHSLAGEAGLLGLEQITTLAKGAEKSARRYHESGAEADALGLVERLEDLTAAVVRVTTETRS
jgi:HPt (histidine-containing phosphotransfer) domain-containing protein